MQYDQTHSQLLPPHTGIEFNWVAPENRKAIQIRRTVLDAPDQYLYSNYFMPEDIDEVTVKSYSIISGSQLVDYFKIRSTIKPDTGKYFIDINFENPLRPSYLIRNACNKICMSYYQKEMNERFEYLDSMSENRFAWTSLEKPKVINVKLFFGKTNSKLIPLQLPEDYYPIEIDELGTIKI